MNGGSANGGSPQGNGGAGGHGGAGGAGGRDITDGSAGGAGEPDADASTAPVVASLSPEEAHPGDVVTVRGEHFLPAPEILLGDRRVSPSNPATDNRVEFVVPEDVQLLRCSQDTSLHVVSAGHSSNSTRLVLSQPPPQLSAQNARVAAGTVLALEGKNLDGARMSIGSTILTAPVVESSKLEVAIPRTTPPGDAELLVKTECGEATLPLTVLTAPPMVLSADLPSVSPEGVVMLTVDLSQGASVKSVHVGAIALDVSDTGQVAWVPQSGKSDGTQVLAVRVPSSIPAGSAKIVLDGPTTSSDPFNIGVVISADFSPTAASKIVFTPPSTAGYPVGTTSAFPQADVAAPTGGYWTYDLQFHRTRINGTTCETSGTITGVERHSSMDGLFDSRCPSAADVCNDIKEGTYSADKTSNTVTLSIDRRSAAGPENYVGGWTSAANLVLRSQRTGRQLLIKIQFEHDCIL